VSEADRAVEEALRERIARDRPGESVLGEEEGGPGGDWVIDPIDATKNYVRGIPLFATLIALEGRAAVVSAPALGRRWWASRGEGAFADGRPIRVSAVARVDDCVLTFTSPRGHGDGFWRLVERCWAPRGFGDFWQYMLLAEGAVDLCVEAEAKLWDLAAPKLIVDEAGGRLTSLRGEDTAGGGDCLASNGALHDEALRELAEK
jgi:histidinol-phosphatase